MFIKQVVQFVVDVFGKRFAVILIVGVVLAAIFLSVVSIQSVNAGFVTGKDNMLPTNEESGSMFIYLPLVMRNFSSVLTPPVLNTINNDDGDGNYTISWSASNGAAAYTLQEADTADFSNPSTVYAGSATSTDISGRYLGTYYYRVRASSAHADSDWSNVESVDVTVVPDCPAIGMWYGTTSQGQNSVITFEVQDLPYCRIPESVIGVNPKFGFTIRFWDSCGTERNITNLDEILIVNQRFNFSGGNGTYEGEFTSFNTASGTFSYNNGGCLASGTWTAEIPAPGPFSKISPVDGAIGLPPSSLPLRWEASAQADSYEYCYDTTDDNACANWISAASETLVNMEGLSPETTYYWQVRAVSNVGSTYANGTLTAFWSFTTGELSAWTWTQMTATAGWTPRSIHTSVALPDGSIVLMGGYDGVHDYFNDVWRSTDQGATWMQMTAAAEWTARTGHTSVALPDGSIVLMGGYDGSYRNDVWRSTDQGATWTQMTAAAEWSARRNHASVALPDGSIVLMGGYDETRLNDVWRSTDMGATWTLVTAAAEWSARSNHTSVVLPDGSIVLLGGHDGTRFNDVWRSTDQGATWTQMTATAEWSARAGHTSVALPDGSIVLMGGYNYPIYFNDVWHSTDQGATWTQMTTTAGWTARHDHTSVALPDGSIVLMGGWDRSRLNDVWLCEKTD